MAECARDFHYKPSSLYLQIYKNRYDSTDFQDGSLRGIYNSPQKRRQKELNDGTGHERDHSRTFFTSDPGPGGHCRCRRGGTRRQTDERAKEGARKTLELEREAGGGPKWSGGRMPGGGGPSTELRRARREKGREKLLGVTNRVRATTRHVQEWQKEQAIHLIRCCTPDSVPPTSVCESAMHLHMDIEYKAWVSRSQFQTLLVVIKLH